MTLKNSQVYTLIEAARDAYIQALVVAIETDLLNNDTVEELQVPSADIAEALRVRRTNLRVTDLELEVSNEEDDPEFDYDSNEDEDGRKF